MKDVVDRSTSAMTDVRRVDAIASAEKTARLRAAVEEAKVEIAAYRTEREARYAAMVNEGRDKRDERTTRRRTEAQDTDGVFFID